MVYSCDLGEVVFSDRAVHCCFNIYTRPSSGSLNKKPSYDLPKHIVSIIDYRKDKDMIYDSEYIRICSRGSRAGEVVRGEFMSNEIWIDVKKSPIATEIIEAVHKYNYWNEPYSTKNNTVSARLPKWRFCQYLINIIKQSKKENK